MKNSQKPLAAFNSIPYGVDLNRFVLALNEIEPASNGKDSIQYELIRPELRKLVAAWFQSGPNTSKLFAGNPRLAFEAKHSGAFIMPTNTGNANFAIIPMSGEFNPTEPRDIAMRMFLTFLISSWNRHLAGPCLECGNYFANESARNRRYCSEACGHRRTSREANERRRSSDHAKQVELVNALTLRWQDAKTRLSWKEWLADTGKVKKAWLTRAVNRKIIREPQKR